MTFQWNLEKNKTKKVMNPLKVVWFDVETVLEHV